MWDPNAAEAVLLSDEFGVVVLALKAHSDDPDKRCVVLKWQGAQWCSWGEPNDEARSGHPLWASGLGDVLWGGVVRDSMLVSELERRNQVHPLHGASRFTSLTHWVILTKERTAEVAAASFELERVAGSTPDAAVAIMGRRGERSTRGRSGLRRRR